MSRDKKRVFKSASVVEYKSLEGYFEEMALKGWLLEKMGFGMTFKKIKPQKLTFNVALLSPKTMLDWPDNEEASTYDEFCKSAGWELAAESQVYRIYYRLAELEGPPIYTDDEDIYTTVKKSFFKSEFGIMLLPLLYIAMAVMNYKNIRYDIITSNLFVFNLMSPFIITGIMWMITAPSLYWVIINGKRISNSEPLFYYSSKWVKNKYRLQFVAVTLYLLLLIGAVVYDSISEFPISFFLVGLMPMVLIVFFMILFKKFIQKKSYPLVGKIIYLVIAWGISMVIGVGTIFTVIGSGVLGSEEDEIVELDNNIITLEEMGILGTPKRDRWRSESSLFVPLSYEYYESVEIENEDRVSIRVEGLQMANVWLRDWVVRQVLKEEKERYHEEVQYDPDLKNYIKEIYGYEEFGVRLYNLSENGYRVMVVKDTEVYLIGFSGILEEGNLEKALVGLFN